MIDSPSTKTSQIPSSMHVERVWGSLQIARQLVHPRPDQVERFILSFFSFGGLMALEFVTWNDIFVECSRRRCREIDLFCSMSDQRSPSLLGVFCFFFLFLCRQKSNQFFSGAVELGERHVPPIRHLQSRRGRHVKCLRINYSLFPRSLSSLSKCWMSEEKKFVGVWWN